jgi:hypothetical protein
MGKVGLPPRESESCHSFPGSREKPSRLQDSYLAMRTLLLLGLAVKAASLPNRNVLPIEGRHQWPDRDGTVGTRGRIMVGAHDALAATEQVIAAATQSR